MDQLDKVVQTILSEWKVLYPSIKECSIYPVGFNAPNKVYVCVEWKEPVAARVPKEFRDFSTMMRKHPEWALCKEHQREQEISGVITWLARDKMYSCALAISYLVEANPSD